MTIQITIVGTGLIGASIGLALANQKPNIQRVGHDREPGNARKAEKMGAFDRVSLNLPNAVREADIVILALPVDQVRETLKTIAPDLKSDAVVLDTAPIKEALLNWAREILPTGRYYIGMTPVINPHYLYGFDLGTDAAKSDLFQNGLLAVVTPPGVPSTAIRLTSDLAALLGAEHMFVDAVEIDSFMAATHILPQLLAATLLNMTVDQPGWIDARKVTGKAYALLASTLVQMEGPEALATAALNTKANMVRVIDQFVSALLDLREEIQNQNETELAKRLQSAFEGHGRWWQDRLTGKWSAEATAPPNEIPTAGEWFGRLFGVQPKSRRKQ